MAFKQRVYFGGEGRALTIGPGKDGGGALRLGAGSPVHPSYVWPPRRTVRRLRDALTAWLEEQDGG